jgi:hypothetical protein
MLDSSADIIYDIYIARVRTRTHKHTHTHNMNDCTEYSLHSQSLTILSNFNTLQGYSAYVPLIKEWFPLL